MLPELEFIGDIIKKVFFVDIHTLCVYGNKQSSVYFFIIFRLWVTRKSLLKGVGCFEDWVMVANMGLYDQSTYILSSKVYGAIDIQHLVWSCSRRVIKAPVRKSELIQVERMKKVEADQNSMSRSNKNGHVN